MNKSKFFVLIVLIISLNNAFSADRWQSYIRNDWHDFKRNLNFNTLVYSAVWLTGMYGLSYFDEDLSKSVTSLSCGDFKTYFRVVDQLGNAPYSIPMAAGITGLSLTGKNKELQDAAFTSLQASLVAALITGVGKFVIGRARPDEKKGPHFFNPIRGFNKSFPSGHSSTAFALIVPWVYYYPGPLTYVLLALPASTALARMIFERHWLTDVLTGSLIGILTGYYLAQWHKRHAVDKKYYPNNNMHKKMVVTLTFPL
jgi:membrane-associated phospholipid phosphatase